MCEPQLLSILQSEEIKLFLTQRNKQDKSNEYLHRLRVESDEEPEILRDSVQEIARHPEVIPHLYPLAGTNLELPLRRHDLEMVFIISCLLLGEH